LASGCHTVSSRVPAGSNACNSAAGGRLVVWFTLNCSLALTLSFSVSATARSKFARIFMAN
jgi:hypothetical protein